VGARSPSRVRRPAAIIPVLTTTPSTRGDVVENTTTNRTQQRHFKPCWWPEVLHPIVVVSTTTRVGLAGLEPDEADAGGGARRRLRARTSMSRPKPSDPTRSVCPMTSMALDPDAAAAIAQMAPGLGAVQALDLERLGDDDLRCLIEAAEVADRRLASAQIALLDAADRRRLGREDGFFSAKALVRRVGRLSPGRAAARDKAMQALRDLPDINAALGRRRDRCRPGRVAGRRPRQRPRPRRHARPPAKVPSWPRPSASRSRTSRSRCAAGNE